MKKYIELEKQMLDAEGKEKVELLIELAIQYSSFNATKSISSGEQALEHAQSLNYIQGIANAFKVLGKGYFLTEQQNTAIQYYKQAEEKFRECGDKNGQASCYEFYAIRRAGSGDYRQALELLDKAFEIVQETQNNNGKASLLHNMAIILKKAGHFDKSKELFKEALNYARKASHSSSEKLILMNLGRLCSEQEDYDEALKYLYRALEIDTEKVEMHNNSRILFLIGVVNTKQGNYASAIKNYNQIIVFAEDIGDKCFLGEVLISLANAYYYSGEHNQGLEVLHQAEKIVRPTGRKQLRKMLCGTYANIYEALGDYRHALLNYKEYSDLEIDLTTLSLRNQIAFLKEESDNASVK